MTKGKTRNRASTLKFVIFMAYLAYLSIGFFPSAPIENDGNGIANGAAIMAVHGFGANDFPIVTKYKQAVMSLLFGCTMQQV